MKATICHLWIPVTHSNNGRQITCLAFASGANIIWLPECTVPRRGTVSKKAQLNIAFTALPGITALKVGLDPWHSDNVIRFICYFLSSTVASGCKVNLPGVAGTMSVNFLFILIGIVELSLPETMLIAWADTLFQSFWKSKSRPMPVQTLFNVSNVAISTMAAYYAYHLTVSTPGFGLAVLLLLAVCV